jgi:RluA family pseudouridine synthase
MIVSSRITKGHKALPLVEYLSNRFTYLSREQWRDRILSHSVLVNQVPSAAEAVLRPGDIVSYLMPDFPEPDADTRYGIAYEDEWILAVNKPGNLLVHKAGKSITRNLVFLLRHASGNPRWAAVHAVSRLDRETSGLVLFAKDMETLRKLHRDFAARAVAKEYVAIVHHAPDKPLCAVDLPIGRDTASQISYKFCVDPEKGKNACTVIEWVSGNGGYSLVLARPATGRTHQIRIHCAAIGIPVVGDKLYGLSEEAYLVWRNDPQSRELEFPRQALHCLRLTFDHPATKKKISLESPIPPDMAALAEKLGLKFP